MKSDVSIAYGYPFGTVKIGFLESKIKKIHQKFSEIAVMEGWEIFTRLAGGGGEIFTRHGGIQKWVD